jgi:hypothetical protein
MLKFSVGKAPKEQALPADFLEALRPGVKPRRRIKASKIYLGPLAGTGQPVRPGKVK